MTVAFSSTCFYAKPISFPNFDDLLLGAAAVVARHEQGVEAVVEQLEDADKAHAHAKTKKSTGVTDERYAGDLLRLEVFCVVRIPDEQVQDGQVLGRVVEQEFQDLGLGGGQGDVGPVGLVTDIQGVVQLQNLPAAILQSHLLLEDQPLDWVYTDPGNLLQHKAELRPVEECLPVGEVAGGCHDRLRLNVAALEAPLGLVVQGLDESQVGVSGAAHELHPVQGAEKFFSGANVQLLLVELDKGRQAMTLRDDFLEGALVQAVPDRVPVRKT